MEYHNIEGSGHNNIDAIVGYLRENGFYLVKKTKQVKWFGLLGLQTTFL